jgi:hypothetical protein
MFPPAALTLGIVGLRMDERKGPALAALLISGFSFLLCLLMILGAFFRL